MAYIELPLVRRERALAAVEQRLLRPQRHWSQVPQYARNCSATPKKDIRNVAQARCGFRQVSVLPGANRIHVIVSGSKQWRSPSHRVPETCERTATTVALRRSITELVSVGASQGRGRLSREIQCHRFRAVACPNTDAQRCLRCCIPLVRCWIEIGDSVSREKNKDNVRVISCDERDRPESRLVLNQGPVLHWSFKYTDHPVSAAVDRVEGTDQWMRCVRILL